MCECNELYDSNVISSYGNNNLECAYHLTEDQDYICCKVTEILDNQGKLIVCCCGLILNSITIFLFFNKELARVFFNRLLLCLAVIDNLYLTIRMFEPWQTSSFYHCFVFHFVLYPFGSIVMCCTIYMTILLSLERYNDIVKPLNSQVRNNQQSDASWARGM